MRKWGPAVMILLVLGVFLVWAQCVEEPIAEYKATSAADLRPLAVKVLGEEPKSLDWSGAAHTKFSMSSLEPRLGDLVASVGEPSFDRLRNKDSLARLESSMALSDQNAPGTGALVDSIQLDLATCRAALAAGNRERAAQLLALAATATRDAVNTATTVEEWQQSQIARLRFLEVAPVLLRSWSQSDIAKMGSLSSPSHRASLGRVLAKRFLDKDVQDVAEASARSRPSHAVSFALFGTENGEEDKLIAVLIHRHPRTFSPEQTVEAGAESVKSLLHALDGPWVGSREVLDRVAATQKFWTDFQAMLGMDEKSATAKIAELSLAIKSLENPVGLAVLHGERTSWSGLVQSAYVADAKEAGFTYLITGSAQDPISGGPLKVNAGKVTFTLSDDEDYPFVKALSSTPLSIGR